MGKTDELTIDEEDLRARVAAGDKLFTHEVRWLQDRGERPAGYEPVPVTFDTPAGDVISNDPTYFAGLQAQDASAFERLVNERAAEIAKEMVIAEQQGSQAAIGENHGTAVNEPRSGPGKMHPQPSNDEALKALEELDAGDEADGDVEEDYLGKEWTNDSLRAELAGRNLSVDGKKADMAARLVRSDNDELEDGDEAVEEE